MKKIIIAMFCVVFSANVYAGKNREAEALQARNAPFSQANLIKSSNSAEKEVQEGSFNDGLITPNFATTVYRTTKFTYGANLEILICPPMGVMFSRDGVMRCTIDEKNAFKTLRGMVPAGKTFVGFKSYLYKNDEYIEIYMR